MTQGSFSGTTMDWPRPPGESNPIGDGDSLPRAYPVPRHRMFPLALLALAPYRPRAQSIVGWKVLSTRQTTYVFSRKTKKSRLSCRFIPTTVLRPEANRKPVAGHTTVASCLRRCAQDGHGWRRRRCRAGQSPAHIPHDRQESEAVQRGRAKRDPETAVGQTDSFGTHCLRHLVRFWHFHYLTTRRLAIERLRKENEHLKVSFRTPSRALSLELLTSSVSSAGGDRTTEPLLEQALLSVHVGPNRAAAGDSPPRTSSALSRRTPFPAPASVMQFEAHDPVQGRKSCFPLAGPLFGALYES